MRLLLLVLSLTLLLATATSATENECPGLDSNATIVLLLPNNNVLWFSAGNSRHFQTKELGGVSGQLLAIDVRPRGRALWGLSDSNGLYQIDLQSGQANLASNLSQPLTGGNNYGMDFNPTVDRLRLVSSPTNFRVNVDNGAVIVDGNIAFAGGDRNQSTEIAGVAYTNNTDNATATTLYGITVQNGNSFYLVTINPPNNGTLNTIGNTFIRGCGFAGFDIHTSSNGCNTALFATNNRFYFLDLNTGRGSPVWVETSLWLERYMCGFEVLGLAIM